MNGATRVRTAVVAVGATHRQLTVSELGTLRAVGPAVWREVGCLHGVCGSVTKPIFCTPARCAAAKAWATRS